MDAVYKAVIGFAKSLFALQGTTVSVEGAQHIPATGGAVMAINHIGYLDFAYAGVAALPERRFVRFMCKESIFRHWLAGPLMRGMKHIPVDRSSGSASFRAALSALKGGEIVGVFPEATISQSFELKSFKSGAIRMAQAARVPIIPVAVWGSQRVWTKGHPKRLGRHRIPIVVVVGEPIVVERGDNVEQVETRVRAAMTAQLHRAQSLYPPMRDDEKHLWPARLGGSAPTLTAAEPPREHPPTDAGLNPGN